MESHAACAGHVCIKPRTTGGTSPRDNLKIGRSDESTAQTKQSLKHTYTKLSLTETTKTFPASLSLAELTYPGMWFSEQAGE